MSILKGEKKILPFGLLKSSANAAPSIHWPLTLILVNKNASASAPYQVDTMQPCVH
ncbi:hypothetical protein SERLA73DRAFT_179399 [Serpula lacrymans var. lacrymans S7.3]|uniref:Uncharacterized protein n=1 Tax=Serpula lacrymans var. lacrymans (strain S7.3) TaxID=936435 RepID=F8PS78_SERL3|nr:hypothetical protein SERLA73DRAFT_179399 [Serpula lacrymans var. lacrymans S7.3]